MIVEKQLLETLDNRLAQQGSDKEGSRTWDQLSKTLGCFTAMTKELIKRKKFDAVKHCFELSEKLMAEGDHFLKAIVKSHYVYPLGEYVYSIDTMLDLSATESNQLRELFHAALSNEYFSFVMERRA